jgi:hypothetical protein
MSMSGIINIEISSFYDNDRHFSKKYRRLGSNGENGKKSTGCGRTGSAAIIDSFLTLHHPPLHPSRPHHHRLHRPLPQHQRES